MILIQSNTSDSALIQDPLAWLADKATALDLNLLLLHSDEGVVWGRLEKGHWTLSFEAFPHELNAITIQAETLQQARVFNENGEIFVWRTNQGFAWRQIKDEELTPNEYMDEEYWLWGTGLLSVAGFSLLSEGQQGFLHAPPVEAVQENQRLGLHVRHYFTEDTDGSRRIQTSRLVGLKIVEGGKK